MYVNDSSLVNIDKSFINGFEIYIELSETIWDYSLFVA